MPFFAAMMLLIPPSTAWADDERPATMPTRDVEIIYNIRRPRSEPAIEHRFWLAEEGLARIDGTDDSRTIFDLRKGEIIVLNAVNRTYLKLEGALRQPVHPQPGAALERGGAAVVAGHSCIEWSWRSQHFHMHTACLTGDGVLLRLTIEGNTRLEARSVVYRPQQVEQFQVPPDYAPALTSEGGPMH